jgi:hypothetical protein
LFFYEKDANEVDEMHSNKHAVVLEGEINLNDGYA